ncbi:MAG: hypothetical protein JW873_00455 [Candidatus Saganbacteria bacterium]|nr:hypothetical protein [Candidatus Saganbacteria bacterium]
MWQFWGTLAIAAFGGSFLIHYLNNFLLQEKAGFAFDWDGVAERALIAACLLKAAPLWWLPLIIMVKIAGRVAALGFLPLFKAGEPGLVPQKVKTKAELALELCLSPLFALVVGVVF